MLMSPYQALSLAYRLCEERCAAGSESLELLYTRAWNLWANLKFILKHNETYFHVRLPIRCSIKPLRQNLNASEWPQILSSKWHTISNNTTSTSKWGITSSWSNSKKCHP